MWLWLWCEVAGGIQLFNSGCFNRGRPDAMLCGGSIICLFGCLRARMFKKRRHKGDCMFCLVLATAPAGCGADP